MKLKIFIITFFLLSACASQKEAPVQVIEASQPQYLEHRVMYPGETLGLIARWYTGRTENWKTIASANPNLVPAKMAIGETIRVPLAIVNNSNPLPKKAVKKIIVNSKPPKATKKTSKARSKTTTAVNQKKKDSSSAKSAVKKATKNKKTKVTSSLTSKTPVQPSEIKKKKDRKTAIVEDSKDGASKDEIDEYLRKKLLEEESKTSKSSADAEREKLLDELLSQ